MNDLTPAEFDAAIRAELRDLSPADLASALPVVLGLNPNRTPQAVAAAVRSYLAEGRQHVLMGVEVAQAEAVADAAAAQEPSPPVPEPTDVAVSAPPVDGKGWVVQPDPGPRRGGPDSKR